MSGIAVWKVRLQKERDFEDLMGKFTIRTLNRSDSTKLDYYLKDLENNKPDPGYDQWKLMQHHLEFDDLKSICKSRSLNSKEQIRAAYLLKSLFKN